MYGTVVTTLLNIYRHPDELIERLENAGLGYHVDADKTIDKLGETGFRLLYLKNKTKNLHKTVRICKDQCQADRMQAVVC